ncbi:putative Kinase [Zostera marina]|uniref:Putative Kinase n=1 Tax=Zostera marina TaxID=29655 RepID=A0A0K9P627_ZOSMR|nr:putative Kinase [Zostera marina]
MSTRVINRHRCFHGTVLLLFLLCADFFIPTEQQIAFNYMNFLDGEAARASTIDNQCYEPYRKICLHADARIKNGGIDIDYFADKEWGAVTYSEPILFRKKATNQTATFTSEFNFNISYNDEQKAFGGLAFFMSGFPFQNTSGYLQLENGINNSFIAVNLDKDSPYLDSDQIQLELLLNSKTIAKKEIVVGDFDRSGSMTGRIKVEYDSVNSNLSVFYARNSASPNLFHAIDLSTILPENVSIGFVSTSNDSSDEHIIKTWDFFSTFPIIKESSYREADDGKIKENTSSKKWLVGGVIIGMVSLLSLMSVTLFLLKRKMRKEDRILDTEFENAEEGARKLSYDELVKATNNFSSKRKLGEGGFGPVYSGFLKYRNTNVAIKRISGHSKQGKKEYIAEVKIISQLRHKNMVQLVGWCHENGKLLLVYELMENGSLDSFIFNHQKTLSWPLRRSIVKGLASALIYLHQDWKQCVVHRDVKAGNVMLDKTFEAKLGDFGLARLSDHGGGVQTTFMAGTMGYMAPECFITGKGGKESDVYAFGIVALEIACGRKCIDHKTDANKVKLVEWVWKMYGSGSLVDVVDERILNDEDYDEQEVKQLLMVGLCCANPDLEKRPSMSHALAILNFQGSLPTLPMEMPRVGFTASRQHSNISDTTDTTSFISTVELSNKR